jgi:HK97 family phage portal protein
LFNKAKQFFKKGITYGQTIPTWIDKKARWNSWSTERAIKYGYKTSAVVYSCINLISKSASSVPWHVYRRNAQGEKEVVPNHPLSLLIEKPNPFMSRKDLIERITSHLYLGGNSITSKVRANDIVSELWILPPDAMKIVPSQTDFISHYEYRADGIVHRIETRDIIHNKFIDPGNMFWGMSPLQAGAKQIDTDVSAMEWNKVSLQNRAITDGVFSFENPLTHEQWTEARKMVREQYSGASNAHTPWVLGNNAKWQPLSLSPQEMDFIESRKFTREEICSIFGVPPVMIGYYENATLANIETGRKIFWQDTIVPYLEDLKNCLNLALSNDFGGEDLELSYDLSKVDALQENMTEKITNAKSLWSMGVPFNMVNQRMELDFDDIPGGDVGYLPSSLLPSDLAGEMFTSEPQNEPQENEEDTSKGIAPPSNKKAHTGDIKALDFTKDIHRDFYWKSYERRRNRWYQNVTRKSAKIYKEMGEKVSNAFLSGDQSAAEKSIESFEQKWNKSFVSWWTEMVKEFGTETFDNLKKDHRSYNRKDEGEDAFDPYDQIIQHYIAETSAEKIVTIVASRKKEVNKIIDAMREGTEQATMDDIARAIKQKFDDLSRYSAYRIARTEVVGASNYGSYQGAKSTGIPMARYWITSRDDRVRDEHEQMDGKKIGMEESFTMPSGEKLTFPGDYNADAPGNSINCRCTVAYKPL